jgi:CRP/FNR family transcriptional regulator, cyclic AMP receptor protein
MPVLPDNILKQVFSHYPLTTFQKHDTILAGGSSNFYVHLIESGYVRSYLVGEEGWLLTINIYSPGAIFPLTQVIAGMGENPYEFQALTTTTIRSAPALMLLSFLEEHPEVLFPLTRRFASGIEGVVKRLSGLIKATCRQRVLSAFDLLMKKAGTLNPDGSISIMLPHTHQDIADIAGVSRETVTRELLWLKQAGVVENCQRTTIVKRPERFLAMLSHLDLPQADLEL